jgi:hypothetical protein
MSTISKSHDGQKYYTQIRISDTDEFSVRAQKPRGVRRTTISITAATPASLRAAIGTLTAELNAIYEDAATL